MNSAENLEQKRRFRSASRTTTVDVVADSKGGENIIITKRS